MKEYVDRVNRWKEQLGCYFCTENDSCCIDFHHLDPQLKVASVSRLIRSRKWLTIIEEIKKCILLCSNCHRKVHAGRLTLPTDISWDHLLGGLYGQGWPVSAGNAEEGAGRLYPLQDDLGTCG